jgi:hypothetical protein
MSNACPNTGFYPSQQVQQSYPPHPQYPPTAHLSYPLPGYPPGPQAYQTEAQTYPVQSFPVNTSQAGPSAAWQQQQPAGYTAQGSSSSAPWPQEQQQQQPAQHYAEQQPEGAVGADGSRGLGSSLLGAGHKVSSCSHYGRNSRWSVYTRLHACSLHGHTPLLLCGSNVQCFAHRPPSAPTTPQAPQPHPAHCCWLCQSG